MVVVYRPSWSDLRLYDVRKNDDFDDYCCSRVMNDDDHPKKRIYDWKNDVYDGDVNRCHFRSLMLILPSLLHHYYYRLRERLPEFPRDCPTPLLHRRNTWMDPNYDDEMANCYQSVEVDPTIVVMPC